MYLTRSALADVTVEYVRSLRRKLVSAGSMRKSSPCNAFIRGFPADISPTTDGFDHVVRSGQLLCQNWSAKMPYLAFTHIIEDKYESHHVDIWFGRLTGEAGTALCLRRKIHIHT